MQDFVFKFEQKQKTTLSYFQFAPKYWNSIKTNPLNIILATLVYSN